MPVVTPSNPHDTQAAVALLIIFTACLCAIYWRAALRVILIAAIALAIYGAIVGIDSVSSAVTAHH